MGYIEVIAHLLTFTGFPSFSGDEWRVFHKPKNDSAGPQNEFNRSCFLKCFFFECEQKEQHGRYINDIHKVSAENKTICPATPYEIAPTITATEICRVTSVDWGLAGA